MNKNLRDRIFGRYAKGAARCLMGAWVFLMLGAGQSALAAPTQVVITEVFVDDPVLGQVTIIGMDFDSGQNPTVTLGEFAAPLVVLNVMATEIVAELPAGITVGDYLLGVTTGSGGGRSDVYNLTIGAPAAPAGLPTNAIILWAQSNACPAGFTRLTSFDGRFLVSSNTAGTLGGSDNHSHDAGTFTGPSHRHNLEPWNGSFSPVDDNSGGTDFNARTDFAGGGTMTGTSGSADSRPAFATVLLCRRN